MAKTTNPAATSAGQKHRRCAEPIGDDHYLLPAAPVGHGPAERAQQNGWQRNGRPECAYSGGRTGAVEEHHRCGGEEQPIARNRHALGKNEPDEPPVPGSLHAVRLPFPRSLLRPRDINFRAEGASLLASRCWVADFLVDVRLRHMPETKDRVIGPLRELRAPLYEGLRTLQIAGDAIGSAETRVAIAALDNALVYLADEFVPTARAEEFTMFIAVDGVIGATGASAVMVAQHRSIAAMVGDLSQVINAARTDSDVEAYSRYLRPLLHGLYALIRAHLEAEDDAYLAVLDEHLSESQVGMLVDNITRIRTNAGAPVR